MNTEEESGDGITISLAKSDGTKVMNSIKTETKQSEITIKQFLDLLKTAYQVHDNLEGLLLSKGMTDVVDWIKLKGMEEDGRNHDLATTSSEFHMHEMAIDEIENKMQEKLTSVINEGIMDSVLPLIVPSPSSSSDLSKPIRKTTITKAPSIDKIANINIKRKSSTQMIKSDSEIEIHVCDEIKGVKKDFLCNQKLLVEQMGYFADVTKDQRLEDMEISVHCDVNIFDWLMRWVQRDQHLPGDQPSLEVTNAVPILVSASFLQMEPLVNECLHFCHKNMNEIVKTSSSLSCLNDSILTRLAAMYTNTEVETIKDRKDKIQSKLYCKLIQSLCEIETETLRGHYCTMGRVYRCKNCHQLINPKYGMQIPCVPNYMQLQFDGSINNNHKLDPDWDLNEYILSLYKSLKSWRKVYWRLWGSCHFLSCNACKKYFPVKQEGWCRFHPDLPQFFTLDTQKPPLPVGRYPCCGERAYRFQVLEDRSGCQFRDHTISTSDIKDAAIASLLENMRNVITEEPPKLVFPDRLTRLIAREPTDPDDSKLEAKEIFWWDGLEIVQARPKLGLLNELEMSHSEDDVDEDDDHSDDETPRSDTTTTGSTSGDSEESSPSPSVKKKVKPKPKKKLRKSSRPRLWQINISSRSNQDIQRFNEELMFKKMFELLNTRTKLTAEIETTKNSSRSSKPGGIWVRLESEWKEKNMPAVNKAKTMLNGKVRMKTNRVL